MTGTGRHRPHGAGIPEPFLTVCPLEGCRGVRAAGEVGPATRTVWERLLDRAVREGEGAYHLELSGVTFVDVAGDDALVAAAGRLGDGRRFVVRRPPPALRRVLEMFWPDHPTIEVSMS